MLYLFSEGEEYYYYLFMSLYFQEIVKLVVLEVLVVVQSYC